MQVDNNTFYRDKQTMIYNNGFDNDHPNLNIKCRNHMGKKETLKRYKTVAQDHIIPIPNLKLRWKLLTTHRHTHIFFVSLSLCVSQKCTI